MNVFLSSLIRGYAPYREAAASGAMTLGHEVSRAEDFGASPDSAQSACLAGVRRADVVVLLLGSWYGQPQASGLSATHEEYREARDARPVIVFIEAGITPDPAQSAFIKEVQGWERGHFTTEFSSPADLRDKVIRALHEYALAIESGGVDEAEMIGRAEGMQPASRNFSGTELSVAVACGPRRAVLRPAELENASLHQFLMAEALTGTDALLSTSHGTEAKLRGDSVVLAQNNGTSLVSLDEMGGLLVVRPAIEPGAWRNGIPSIIEEDVREDLSRVFRFASRVLDRIDAPQRLSHVALSVAMRGTGHMPWRSREEQQRSPNAATMSMRGAERIAATLSPPVRRRAALRHDHLRMAEDFAVRLRREVKG